MLNSTFQKGKLPLLENELNDPNKFKDFYQFTFNYAKEHAQKGIDLDMAIAYWNIVLQGHFKFLDLWCKFLTVNTLSKCYSSNRWKNYMFHAKLLFLNRKITNVQFQKTHGIYYWILHRTLMIICQTMMQKVLGPF